MSWIESPGNRFWGGDLHAGGFSGEHSEEHLWKSEERILQKEIQQYSCNRSLSYPKGSLELGWPLRISQIETIRLGLYISMATNHWLQAAHGSGYELGKDSSLWPKANPRETQKWDISNQCTQRQRNKGLGLEVRDGGGGDSEQHKSASTTVHPWDAQIHLHFVLSLSHLGKASSGFWLVSFPEEPSFFFPPPLWPCYAACGILVPQPGIAPAPAALEAQSLNHWTVREVPSKESYIGKVNGKT